MEDKCNEDERPTLRGNSEVIGEIVEHYKSLDSKDPEKGFTATQENSPKPKYILLDKIQFQ